MVSATEFLDRVMCSFLSRVSRFSNFVARAREKAHVDCLESMELVVTRLSGFQIGFLKPWIDAVRDAVPKAGIGRQQSRDLRMREMYPSVEQLLDDLPRIPHEGGPEFLVGDQASDDDLNRALGHSVRVLPLGGRQVEDHFG